MAVKRKILGGRGGTPPMPEARDGPSGREDDGSSRTWDKANFFEHDSRFEANIKAVSVK
ncbi:MAG: hypothetical protein AB1696_26085 [Planctomycetota bacterium]